MKEFTARRRIDFADTDMGGIVHFSRFFVFMETAEHLFHESLGSSVDLDLEGRRIGWPRVTATCDYKSPARFGDELEIHVKVNRKGRSSMTYGFRFTVEGREIASGRMTSVCCEMGPGGQLTKIEIPRVIAERFAIE